MRRCGFFGINGDRGQRRFGAGLKGCDFFERHRFEVLIGAQDQSGCGCGFGKVKKSFGCTELAEFGGVELAE